MSTLEEWLRVLCNESRARIDLNLSILKSIFFGHENLGLVIYPKQLKQLRQCCVCFSIWIDWARWSSQGQKISNYTCKCDVKHDDIPGMADENDTNLAQTLRRQDQKFDDHLSNMSAIASVLGQSGGNPDQLTSFVADTSGST